MTRRGFLKTTSVALAVGPMATVTRLAAPVPTSGHRSTDVVIFLYDRMTALDAIGPYEVLRCVPGVRVRSVAKTAGLVRPDSGLQMLNAEHGLVCCGNGIRLLGRSAAIVGITAIVGSAALTENDSAGLFASISGSRGSHTSCGSLRHRSQ